MVVCESGCVMFRSGQSVTVFGNRVLDRGQSVTVFGNRVLDRGQDDGVWEQGAG